MGDRVNVYFDQGNVYSVGLYCHWLGEYIDDCLKDALKKAKPRWDDPEYATRIIISSILKPEIDEETGYGIFAVETGRWIDPESGYRVVDFANKKIRNQDNVSLSFTEFMR